MSMDRQNVIRICLWISCILLQIVGPFSHASLIVVPNSAAAVEGNAGSLVPFSAANDRYQQVYASSQFAALPVGGAYLTAIAFRVYPDGSSYSFTFPGLQVSLSTTAQAPDGLSTIFDDNLGTDDVVVFIGAVPFTTSGIGIPAPFELVINFTTPFFYNPASGNLLVDIRNSGGGPDSSFDAVYDPADSVSRVDGALTDSTGIPNTIGLVTQFAVPAFTTNADLSGLIMSSGSVIPAFSTNVTNYVANVPNATTSLSVTPTAADNGTIQVRVNGSAYAPVTSGSPSTSLPLNVGDNPIDVKVTSLYGSNVKVYTVTVTRAAAPPTVTTLAASAITGIDATLNGSVDPNGSPTTAWFEWGDSAAYGNRTPPIGIGTGSTFVPATAAVTGLTPSLTYHFRIVSTNLAGGSYGADQTFIAPGQLVTSLADGGLGSLRIAINASLSGGFVGFAPGLAGTITLTNGELAIGRDLTIIGPGAANLTVSGNNVSRVFEVTSNTTVNMFGLTVANGLYTGDGLGSGGGILNNGALTLSNCVVTGDEARGLFTVGPGLATGGGIQNNGNLWLYNCVVSSNAARGTFPAGSANGGGIQNNGYLYLLGSTLSGNSAIGADDNSGNYGGSGAGGAIYNQGTMSLFTCTLSGNGAAGGSESNLVGPSGNGYGGGIYNAGPFAAVSSCTISGNSGYGGGNGFFHGGDAKGGGVYAASGALNLGNSIVAGNSISAGYGSLYIGMSAGPDVSGTIGSEGFNLVGQTDGSSGWVGSGVGMDLVGSTATPLDPLLGPLQDNGGPTPTMALLPSSAAIDQGKAFGVTTDQRGHRRPQDNPAIPNAAGGDGSDIGAYETDFIPPPATLGPPIFAGGHLQFNLDGQAGANYIIQATTDLVGANWIDLTNNISPFTFVDSDASQFPKRFYRALSGP